MRSRDESLARARAIAAECLVRVIARAEYAVDSTYTRAAKRDEEREMVRRILSARRKGKRNARNAD